MKFLTGVYEATKLFLTANGPTIMVSGGVAAMGAGAVIACKQTLKVEEVLAKHTPDLENIALAAKTAEQSPAVSYDAKDAQSDRIKVYTRTALDLGKLYAVPGVLFVGGTCLVFGGHHIMLQRNATLAIAFTAVKKQFDNYRARVVNQYGTEADQAFLGGYTIEEFEGENGPELRAKRDWDEARLDPYNRVFERGASSQWQDDLSVNKMFIQNQLRMANIKLGLTGKMYLSEIYEALGFPESDISRVVGWKATRNPDGSRNIPVIDFGLDKPHPDDWKYTAENGIYLDFNCQGLIIGGKVQKALEASPV